VEETELKWEPLLERKRRRRRRRRKRRRRKRRMPL